MQDLVQRGDGTRVHDLGRAAELGTAGHAHASAETADGDLVAFIHQPGAWSQIGMGLELT